MNTKRRILLIAIASWGIIGYRRHSKNPVTAGFSLIKSILGVTRSAAKVSYPIAKAPLKLIFKGLFFGLKSIFFSKNK